MPSSFNHGYALLVGVGQCQHTDWSLPATVNDTQAVHRVLIDPNLCAYPSDKRRVRLLNNQEAGAAAILGNLGQLKRLAKADPDATVVVYYSGHGWIDAADGAYYLITHEADPNDVPGSALPAADFADALRDIPARRLLVILDACHAAGMASAKPRAKGAPAPQDEPPPGYAKSAPPPPLVKALVQGAGRAVLSSSTASQLSYVRKDRALSIFTHHLIEAFHGAGNQPGDAVVRLSNLMNHLGKAVPASARKQEDVEQVPFYQVESEDFAVAVLRGGKGLPAGGWGAVRAEAEEYLRGEARHVAERGVLVEGDVTDSVIITGDGNTVQKGKYNVSVGKARGLAIGDGARVNSDGPDDTPDDDA